MEPMSSVVKSKSSNSAKTNVSAEHRNKKSRSNAEFQPYVVKKRGVYVEKKLEKTGIAEPAKNQVPEKPIKAPPRPRPGQRRFLDSVLMILSKSTTGTQYPETGENKKRVRKRIAIKNTPEIGADDDIKKEIKEKRNKKTKFRSKALNDEVDKPKPKQVVVLQSKKEIVQTPSIYSENNSFNWSNLPSLVKKNEPNDKLVENNVQIVANPLAREIMEGRESKKERRVRIDEPTTLVAESAIKEPVKETTGKDSRLYNFFVDLLETTISVYNVKAEYDKAPNPPSERSSDKMALEIDENVAKKLYIGSPKPEKEEESATKQFYCLKDLEHTQGYNQSYSHEYKQRYSSPSSRKSYSLRAPQKKKFQAESFSFLRKPTPRKLQSASVADAKRPFSRKEKKKTLINLFKEQLQMDDDAFEEPQNLYEALKVIAQNKRRCQKTIHFEDSLKRKYKDSGFPECMLKRHKVISRSTKSNKNKNKKPVYSYTPSIAGRYSEVNSVTKNKDIYVSDFDESCHSIEVYGYDYEDPIVKMPTYREKQIVFTYNTTPSSSINGLEDEDLLDFKDSDSMFFNEYLKKLQN